MVRDKAESDVVRALSDAQNSQTSNDLVEKREEGGPQFERVEGRLGVQGGGE